MFLTECCYEHSCTYIFVQTYKFSGVEWLGHIGVLEIYSQMFSSGFNSYYHWSGRKVPVALHPLCTLGCLLHCKIICQYSLGLG